MRKIVSLLVFLFLANLAWSQGKITGNVRDQSGEIVPFATITVKGTKTSVAADANANFTIAAKAGDVLAVSAVGTEATEVTVTTDAVVNITVNRTSGSINDVVVTTALGIKRNKSELPYAVQEVKGSAITETRGSNFINGLQGQASGIQIRQNNNLGGSTDIIVRGYKSLTGNNQALFVIDGVPIDNTNTNSSSQRSGFAGFDYGNSAADINPDDIASVTILKGAAATALYGSRAANGVILINTKKARRGLGITINAGTTTGSMDKSTFPKYQNKYGAGYVDNPYNLYSGDGDGSEHPGLFYYDVNGDGQPDYVVPSGDDASFGEAFDPNLQVYQWVSADPTNPNYGKPTPWVPAANGPASFFITPVSTSFNGIIEGANEKGSFKLGYTRNEDKGIMVNSGIVRQAANFSSSYELVKNLTASASINYTGVSGVGRYGNGYGDPSSIAGNFREWWETNVDIQDLKNAYFNSGGQNISWNMKSIPDNTNPAYWDNPYFSRYQNYENDTRKRYIGNFSLNYQARPWLNFLGRVSLDHYDEMQEERTAIGSLNVSGYNRYNHTFSEYNYDLMATVDKKLNEDFKLSGVTGVNIRKTLNSSIFAATNGGLVIPKVYALSNSLNPITAPVETQSTIQVNGVYAGATLAYKEMLILDLSGRNDVSSTLPTDANSYLYGSASGSFVFSRLIKNASWLDLGKLRLNFASVGNSAPFASVLDAYSKPTGFGSVPFFVLPTTKNNADLKPERTKSFEIGVNAQMFKNRFGLDVTYYKTNSIDQILPVAVSDATGFNFKYVNAGNIENKGLEVSVNGTPLRSKNFSWDINVNWTKNRNKVLSLYQDSKNLQLAGVQGGVSINATVGQPYGTLRGQDYVYYGTDNDPDKDSHTKASAIGQPIITTDGALAGAPLLSDNNQVIGDVNPDWVGSVSNTFKYKAFSLSFLIDIKQGGDVFSIDQWYGQGTGLYPETAGNNDKGNPIRSPVEDGGGLLYKGVNEDGSPNTTYSAITGLRGIGYNALPNKAYVYDASYVKLRSASIGFEFPKKWFGEAQVIKGMNLSVYGRNLWIIHKNLPYADPEDASSSGNVQGFQVGSYPTYRMYGFNLNIRL